MLRYERDGIGRIEELENTKMKLQARLAECEGTVENLNTKLVMLEKSKSQLQESIEDISSRVDQANIINSQMDKKLKQFDKELNLTKKYLFNIELFLKLSYLIL